MVREEKLPPCTHLYIGEILSCDICLQSLGHNHTYIEASNLVLVLYMEHRQSTFMECLSSFCAVYIYNIIYDVSHV